MNESSVRITAVRHHFVDNVRFWSMFSVVAVHATAIFAALSPTRSGVGDLVTTLFKYGTISFFLAAGFLLGKGVQTSTPMAYFGRRLRKVFLPWILWYLVMAAILLASDVLHHRLHLTPVSQLLRLLETRLSFCFLYTAYWFVPNLLLSLGILLIFRRYLHHLWFGSSLLAMNLFYAVNIYMHWLPTGHTVATFGFVFYLWLGTYLFHRHAAFDAWAARTPMMVLLCLLAGTLSLSFGEGMFLRFIHSEDALNTLRISNQLFSLSAALVLYKLRSATWPRFVDVPRNTFGVYLIHPCFLLIVWSLLKHPALLLPAKRFAETGGGSFILWLLLTVVTYSVSLALAKAIAGQPRLSWAVGAEALRASPVLHQHIAPIYLPKREISRREISGRKAGELTS